MAEPTIQEVTRLVNAIERDTRDVAYAAAIKFDVQEIEGTRYRIRLSEEEPQR